MAATTSLQRLAEIGFQCCGQWEPTEAGGIRITLNQYASSTNALYAFVSKGEVLYIGKTTQQLRRRLYGYQNPRSSQATNLRGNAAISAALQIGKLIQVYVLPDHGLLRFGGFHLNLAAGLEDSLINDLRPAWNKRFGREDARAKVSAAKAVNDDA